LNLNMRTEWIEKGKGEKIREDVGGRSQDYTYVTGGRERDRNGEAVAKSHARTRKRGGRSFVDARVTDLEAGEKKREKEK